MPFFLQRETTRKNLRFSFFVFGRENTLVFKKFFRVKKIVIVSIIGMFGSLFKNRFSGEKKEEKIFVDFYVSFTHYFCR